MSRQVNKGPMGAREKWSVPVESEWRPAWTFPCEIVFRRRAELEVDFSGEETGLFKGRKRGALAVVESIVAEWDVAVLSIGLAAASRLTSGQLRRPLELEAGIRQTPDLLSNERGG